jgi:aromatic ring hydroxylase
MGGSRPAARVEPRQAEQLYSIENYPRVMYVLRDMSGQGLVSRFPKAVWENPEFGEKLEEFLPGTGVTAREKNRFFNFVWDLTTGSHASRVGQFENVNAMPRYFISELVYQHYDRSEMAKFVRRFAGISPEAHT